MSIHQLYPAAPIRRPHALGRMLRRAAAMWWWAVRVHVAEAHGLPRDLAAPPPDLRQSWPFNHM